LPAPVSIVFVAELVLWTVKVLLPLPRWMLTDSS